MKTTQAGAALLAVLVVSITLTVLLGFASNRMQGRLALAQDAKQHLEDLALVNAKTSELTYLLATQRKTAAGVSKGQNTNFLVRNDDGQWLHQLTHDEIRADGYAYKEASGVEYAIQDESGLIPINTSSQYWLKRWLAANGYKIALQGKFAAVLADYADPDDWRRPGGEEPAGSNPGNYLLQTCSELWRLKYWDELLAGSPYFIDVCSPRRSAAMNLNAMPVALWKELQPGLESRVQAARNAGSWVLNDNDLLQLAPGLLTLPDSLYTRLGGQFYRIKVTAGSAINRHRIEVSRGTQKSYVVREL